MHTRDFKHSATMQLQACLLTLLTVSNQVWRAHADYAANAETAASILLQWYNTTTGLFDGIAWWQSANSITTLADLVAADSVNSDTALSIFNNTLIQATNTFPGFINDYYDDEGWWALAWIQVYNLTGDSRYLDAAVYIFDDMVGGWGTPCSGLWWNKEHTQANAIANELFLSVSSHLANLMPGNSTYSSWAEREWSWFQASGLINAQNNINDGLNINGCQNNNATVWSYNQGTILGGLVQYSNLSANDSGTAISTAKSIASAAITKLSDSNGILTEACDPTCDLGGAQFKGIFIRNLGILQNASPEDAYLSFIDKQANSVWSNDRNTTNNELGPSYAGPLPQNLNNFNATTQSSALDALVAAASLNLTNSTPSTSGNAGASDSTTGSATGSSSATPSGSGSSAGRGRGVGKRAGLLLCFSVALHMSGIFDH